MQCWTQANMLPQMHANSAIAARVERLAVGALLMSGMLWGLSWIPLKHFAAEGLPCLAVTLLSYGVVGLLATPLLWRQRNGWRA